MKRIPVVVLGQKRIFTQQPELRLWEGEKIFQLRKLEPTNGDLKEIQRQSRILSLGELTISTELARMVACGDLSLEDAIKRA